MSEGLAALRLAPWKLWIVLVMKFFEGLALLSLMYILVKYLSDDLGFSDVEAGWLFAFCNGMQFPIALALSVYFDSIGAWKMSIFGESVLLVARCVLWFSRSRGTVAFVLLCIYPLGSAALLPALIVGVKRFSNEQSRPYAFSIFYVGLNVASLVVAAYINWNRHGSESKTAMYRSVLLVGFVATCIGLLCSFFTRDAEDLAAADGEARPAPISAAAETLWSKAFWRFMAVVFIFVMIRLVFGHLKATVPKWMTREFGEETPYELYIGINPALIIVLVPICTRVCEALRLHLESSLITGAVISGFSPLVLAISPPSELTTIVFIVVFSVGEAIWSPRLLEYTVAVPKAGREGVYVAWASAPLYLSKFLAGATSGYLLGSYCPKPDVPGEYNHCQTRSLWFAISCMTTVTPILLLVFRAQLFKHEEHAKAPTESTALTEKSAP